MSAPSQRLLTGCLFLAVGLLGWVGLGDLAVGTLMSPGPAFFPKVVSLLLALIGALNVVMGAVSSLKDTNKVTVPPMNVGAFLLVFLGLGAAYLTLPRLGLLPAAFLLVVIVSLATGRARLKETLVLGVLLTAMAVLLFKGVLGVSTPLFLLGDSL